MSVGTRDRLDRFGFDWKNPSGTFVYNPEIAMYVDPGFGTDSVFDLSRDIINFRIVRRVNAISTFNATINNKFSKWDRVISRMSRVVIFLKRTHWVQAFAGYMTEVPYLTVAPGTTTIGGQCTLKRLAHTYWDPYSLEAQHMFPGLFPSLTPATSLPDGGAAAAVYRLLTAVANWDSHQIHVQKIPDAFLRQATLLADKAGSSIDPTVMSAFKQLLDSDGWSGAFEQAASGLIGTGGTTAPGTGSNKSQTPPDQPPNQRGGGVGPGSVPAPTREDPFAVFPIAGGARYGDDFGATRTVGGFHHHAGNDLFADVGTPVLAPFDGMCEDATNEIGGTAVHITGEFGYVYMCHMVAGRLPAVGNHVTAGTVVGYVDNTGDAANTASHCHFEWHPRVILSTDRTYSDTRGAVDPFNYLQRAQGKIIPPGQVGGSSTGGVTPDNSPFNVAYFYPQYDIESEAFTGDRAWINDVPLIQAVTMLTQASLRDIQSAPNGDFVAMYPDKFGMYGKTPAIKIRDIEVLPNFNITLSDEQLKTHVAVAGHIIRNEPRTGLSVNWMFTQGIVSIEQDEVMKLLLGLDPAKTYRDLGADWMLQRFGLRPLRADADMLRTHLWEYLYALHLFQDQWTKQFIASPQFTFMPELYPGMRVELADHGLGFYTEQVTHSGDMEQGFRTQPTLSAPMVKGKDGKWDLLTLERVPTPLPDPTEDVMFGRQHLIEGHNPL